MLDLYTNTEADAGRFERMYGDEGYDDRPTRRECEADEALMDDHDPSQPLCRHHEGPDCERCGS